MVNNIAYDVMDAVRLYWAYTVAGVQSQMQYRASFAMMSVAQFLSVAVEFAATVALFQRFGSLRGWTLPEVAILYGIAHVSFALAEGFGRGFDTFSILVKSGDFDRLLLRPRSTALQVAGQEFQFLRGGRLTQGLLVLIYGMSSLGMKWHLAQVALIAASIFGGACIFYGIFVIQATLAFWTVESLEIMNTVTYGGTEAAQFPLNIYRPWFRMFFTFVVPLAFINYIPAAAFLGRDVNAGFPVWLEWCGPLVGILFVIVSLMIWRLGERHYCSTGS